MQITKTHGFFLLGFALVFQLMSYFICDGECTDYLSAVVHITYAFSSHIADVTCSDPGPGWSCGSQTLIYLSYACGLGGLLALSVASQKKKK